MTQQPLQHARVRTSPALAALAGNDGTAAHPHARVLAADPRHADPRDLADAVHLVCLLHGRHPGVIDRAADRTAHDAAREWLIAAIDGFAAERAALARLASCVGPQPSTPGQAEAEAALVTQRHALDMLAQSDRAGCAIGAALALALDWVAVRDVLAAAATRSHCDLPPLALPLAHETGMVAGLLAEDRAFERAMHFGAAQLLAQQRALWDMLAARAEARGTA